MSVKYASEMRYWMSKYNEENHNFKNDHYKKLMLSILDSDDEAIFKNKIVVDFGCGPRGSLNWCTLAKRRLGVDVLATKYQNTFRDSIEKQNMYYVASTEDNIPLPDNIADILFTINSLDHVNNLKTMSAELLRLLKPDGIFAASFNLFEPSSECEPQCLTIEALESCILNRLSNIKMRFAYKANPAYDNMYKGDYIERHLIDKSVPTIMWVTGKKISESNDLALS